MGAIAASQAVDFGLPTKATEGAPGGVPVTRTAGVCHCTDYAVCHRHLAERRRPLSERWGDAPLSKGWTGLPNKLLHHQAELRIGANELALLAHLISFQRAPDTKVFPSHNALAERMGVSRDVVMRTVKKLEKAGLIEVVRGRDGKQGHVSNVYTWNGLIQRLSEIP